MVRCRYGPARLLLRRAPEYRGHRDPGLLAQGRMVAALEERRRIARDLHDGSRRAGFSPPPSARAGERSEHPTRARLIAAATDGRWTRRGGHRGADQAAGRALRVSLAQCAEEICDRFDAERCWMSRPTLAPPVMRGGAAADRQRGRVERRTHGGAKQIMSPCTRRRLHLCVRTTSASTCPTCATCPAASAWCPCASGGGTGRDLLLRAKASARHHRTSEPAVSIASSSR
jgi:hypothetical protein